MKQALAFESKMVRQLASSRLRAHCASHAKQGLARLRLIDPGRWPLEWCLPSWLGADLAVAEDITRQLVVSNVLGLVALRLEDDVVDGELADCAPTVALELADCLYAAALIPYRSSFQPDHALWPYLERCMTAWRDAASSPQSAMTDTALAARAAPAKVVGAAMCHLAGRSELIPALDEALNQALTAMVLDDQRSDWQRDLAAGRWNPFIASLGGYREARPIDTDKTRVRVLVEQLLGRLTGDYQRRVRASFSRAVMIGRSLSLNAFAAGVEAIATEVDGHADGVIDEIGSLGQHATEFVFGTS